MVTHSPNFQFLARVDPLLAELGARAERYALDDPNTSLLKVRQLAELLAQVVASRFGMDPGSQSKDQRSLIDDLYRSRALPSEIKSLFHEIRIAGNKANHEIAGDVGAAIRALRFARKVSVWFFRTHIDERQKLGPFVPPVPRPDTSVENRRELERLQEEYERLVAHAAFLEEQSATDAELRDLAEREREKAYEELDSALELAEEETARLDAERARFESELAASARQPETEDVEVLAVVGDEIAREILTEDDTRELIDLQLAAAGWEVDSRRLRHANGTRPQKNRNLAIAEWPTFTGPADYVLFIGLRPVGIIEAKRQTIDIPGAIEQAKRYSRDYVDQGEGTETIGPWDNYKVPFLYSSNGRDYLKQLATKSGIWFLDARRATNHPRALVAWHSPDDLEQLLTQDVDEADLRLIAESSDYLPLRDYQREAVLAVEKAIARGDREMLVAMATGTGKTRTCIGICYRMIKANRFRRILFLVDRTSLGVQATESLQELKLENNQSFADIYDVKELGDIKPDSDTKFHVATIQGMVKRVLDPSTENDLPSVGQYDLIVVDECHRGYNLDQELSDDELQFRDEADYISKYSRVLEYFDAVKIGLTATPAVHTLELFGGASQLPVYQYSLRQAVLEGWLIDHEPPIQIHTRLGTDGIHWEANDEIEVYDTGTEQLELFTTPDQVDLEIDSFNRRVITDDFNRVICEHLATKIDPTLPGKTLVYCVTDMHADMVVAELKAAFERHYGSVQDDAVQKITGAAHKPGTLIRKFKNEQLPSVAVTVDLLTTGIDVPPITNLVFLRRVRSRILYEQMLGRATRLCEDLYGPGLDKEVFYIYDCVDLYADMQTHSNMKPVAARPNVTVHQLLDELRSTTDPDLQQVIKEQLVAKLQRKRRSIKGSRASRFENRHGLRPAALVSWVSEASPTEIVEWFADKTALVEYLDTSISGGQKMLISDHEDEVIAETRGFGAANKAPGDYLDEFREYVLENQDRIEALKLCAQRPSALTRVALRELLLALDEKGFNETRLRVAWRETTNADIAAHIIGHIRHAILDAPLEPFEGRVARAMTEILASEAWTPPQRMWLDRLGAQFRENVLVDRDAINDGEFREHGGFDRLNRVFDGRLENLLQRFTDEVWAVPS